MPAGYFDDDDEDTTYETEQSSGPKNLRAALAKAHKEKTELEAQLAAALKQVEDLGSKVKSSTLKDALTEAGLDPKYARFADRDGVEPTKEAVEKWVDENKDVYAFLANRSPVASGDEEDGDEGDGPGGSDPSFEDLLPEGLAEALQSAQKAEQSGRPSGSKDTLTQLQQIDPSKVKDRGQLLELLAAMGAPLG